MKILVTLTAVLISAYSICQIPPINEPKFDFDVPAPPAVGFGTGGQTRSVSIVKDRTGAYLKGPNGIQIGEVYTDIKQVSKNRYHVHFNGRQGLMNDSGSVIIPIIYDSLTFRVSQVLAYNRGKSGLFSIDGQSIIPLGDYVILWNNISAALVKNSNNTLDLISMLDGGVLVDNIDYAQFFFKQILIKKKGKFGVITNEVVVPCEHDSISISNYQKGQNSIFNKHGVRFASYNAHLETFVTHKNRKQGLISIEGKEIYSPDNDMVQWHDRFGYGWAKKDQLHSVYFKKSGKTTGYIFDKVSHDGYGYVLVSINKKWGVYDLNGEELVPCLYDKISVGGDNTFNVTKNGKVGVIAQNGQEIIQPIYDELDRFGSISRDVYAVKLDGKSGLISKNGDVIVPAIYDFISIRDSLFIVIQDKPDRRYGLYDKTGLLYPVEHKKIGVIDGSSVFFLKNNSGIMSLITNQNKLIIKDVKMYHYINNEQLLNAPEYTGLFIAVKDLKNKYGLVDLATNKVAANCMYDSIIQSYMSHSGKRYFIAKKGQAYGMIDEDNKILLPFSFDELSLDLVRENQNIQFAVVAKKKGKYGVLNDKNEIIIPFIYNNLQRISIFGLFKAKPSKSKHYQIINLQNKVIIEDLFDDVANFEYDEDLVRDDLNSSNQWYVEKALTFRDGKMRVITSRGKYLTAPIDMNIHVGFKTFEELKSALINALNSDDSKLLHAFVDKIAPSKHLIYLINENSRMGRNLNYMNLEEVKNKYYHLLNNFRINEWNATDAQQKYDRSDLLDVFDFTGYSSNGIVQNKRYGFIDYENYALNLILKDCMKINGFWISTYFLNKKHF